MFTPEELRDAPTKNFIFYKIDEEPNFVNIYFFNNKFEMKLINFQIFFSFTGEEKHVSITFPKELIQIEEERIEASKIIHFLTKQSRSLLPQV